MVKQGQYLGGVRSLKTLKDRCHVDSVTGCWHFRLPGSGKKPPAGKTAQVSVHGIGQMTVARAAFMLANGRQVRDGYRAIRTCDSYDCAFHGHIAEVKASEAWLIAFSLGKIDRAKHRIAAIKNARSGSAKLTEELAEWARESPQTCDEAAHGLMVSKSRVISIRAGKGWALGAGSTAAALNPYAGRPQRSRNQITAPTGPCDRGELQIVESACASPHADHRLGDDQVDVKAIEACRPDAGAGTS